LLPGFFDGEVWRAQLDRISFKSKSILIKTEVAKIIGIFEGRAQPLAQTRGERQLDEAAARARSFLSGQPLDDV